MYQTGIEQIDRKYEIYRTNLQCPKEKLIEYKIVVMKDVLFPFVLFLISILLSIIFLLMELVKKSSSNK